MNYPSLNKAQADWNSLKQI